MNKFDIIIPVGINEIPLIENVIKLVTSNVKGFNKIYLVTQDKNLKINNCITINEDIFPFVKEDIVKIIGESRRIDWVYQQLLKLYVINVIPNCLDNILIIDADVFILKELDFMSDNKPIFTVGYEHTFEYHEHSKRLHPSLIRIHEEYSGVSHHMLFNKNYLKELFKLVEDFHNKSFFNVFLESIDSTDKNDLKCSEYEIYFNFMCLYHPNNIIIRHLKWGNVLTLSNDVLEEYDYASIPKWLGTR
jgi:hypothetical protein